ncbi:MAG TPA: CPBP family intramembrane glutamic endopeptidase [Acidimicrobiales bacterium]|nr:CPBP family intramembrane glutamic endopeptidase [Acidimicrobiales bacterium]
MIVVVAILGLRNVAGEDLVPASLYVPVNLGLTAVVALVAAGTGMSTSDLGLSRSSARRGLWIGFAGAVAVAVTLAVAAAVPWTRPLFEDQRASSVDGGADLAYHALVRIPLGTVVLEELAFRGALLSMLGRRRSIAVAIVVSSALFGLWHIRPTLSALDANDLASDAVARFAAVSGAVAITAFAGAAFCALRLASGSLLAPMLVHAATNSLSLAIAYVVLGTS